MNLEAKNTPLLSRETCAVTAMPSSIGNLGRGGVKRRGEGGRGLHSSLVGLAVLLAGERDGEFLCTRMHAWSVGWLVGVWLGAAANRHASVVVLGFLRF